MSGYKDLISVIITNYNYGMYVGEAIESIFNQTYPNIELVIINDGSTDNSDKVIKKIIKDNPEKNVVYINRENKGVVYTRNEGIEVSKGKYISYLDADDYFNADYIEKSYKVAIESGADVVYPNWHFVGEWLGKPDTKFPEFTLEGLQLQDLHCTPASLIKKSCISNRRFEADKVAEDWDFFIGLSLDGAKFKLAKDNKINYRVRSGTRSSQLDPNEDLDVFVEILQKHKKIHGDRVINPSILRDKIYRLRNPSTLRKMTDIKNWKKLAGSIKRDGVKPTVVRVGSKAVSSVPVIWNSISHVRNLNYKRFVNFDNISSSKESKLAVVVHLYYPDRWNNIKKHLSRIDQPFDLFVSVQAKDKNVKISKVGENHKNTNLAVLPNRGRDVLPFLVVAGKVLDSGQYDYILKLHSKKSLHRTDGDEWIESLFDQLIPNSIDNIIKTLKKSDTGIVGPADHIVSLSRYMGGNRDRLRYVIETVSDFEPAKILEDSSKYPFFGGTMFWCRADFMRPIVESSLRPVDFSTEKGQVDATTAHALERFFGLAMHTIFKKKMYSVRDGEVSSVDKKEYTENYKYAD